MKFILVALTLAIIIPLACDATAQTDADQMARRITATGAPGAAVGVLSATDAGDWQAIVAVDGLRAAGTDVPVVTTDPWHIGSLSKSMTATLVARLVERGTLSWEDTVGDLLGAVVRDMHPAYRPLTFRHLLSHRAGLPANIGRIAALRLSGTDAGRDARADREIYARIVLAQPPVSTPETEFAYSNAGYVVVGAMLEAATDQSWETLITRDIFDPLGLGSAGFGPPGSLDRLDAPRGHRGTARPRPVAPERFADNIPALGPAGRVHISAPDLLRYAEAHLDGAWGNTDFLSQESWQRLHAPQFGGDYAMGWNVTPGGQLVHSGSNTLWFARIGIDLAARRAFVLLANQYSRDVLRPLFADLTTELFDR
ncbi:serine hydrolase [Sulfitobacter sp. S190]|uniref:serine hydrolase domain-containing protein n=1 Tax=Sulfitobacter sp. S190 TaxID=2867022 RepID=UPI0021A3F782|nr:serine hydrolase domain-containing protein [Sulfitobacter sp. S190]UWR21178.1 beta-lactamase family protein [Sulfitobacter sp. S190]